MSKKSVMCVGCSALRNWLAGIVLAMAPILAVGYEAIPSGQLVGQWITGQLDLKDHSGYMASGTHDAVVTNVNGLQGFRNDAPSGFSGYSYNLNRNALMISNSATSDAGYTNTFDAGITNQFTVSFWAKGELPQQWQPWISKGDLQPAGGGWHVRYRRDASAGYFTIYNGGEHNCFGTINTDTTGWHHYAAVWSKPDGGVRWLYQDGSLIATATNAALSMTIPSGAHLAFGGYQKSGDGSFASDDLWGTYLFDVRVYKQKMTLAQVQNIMTAPPVISSCSVGDYGVVTVSGTNITLLVDFSNPLTNIAMSYVVSNGGTGSPVSGDGCDFSQGPVTYTLTSANGAAQTAYSVSVQRMPNPANALVGRWVASARNLSDVSGYTPVGTHDGIVTNGSVPFTNIVPDGFAGYSLDFSQSGGSVYIKNSETNDAGYLTTFDNTLSNQFTVAFWAKGIPTLNYQAWISKATEGGGSGIYGWGCNLSQSLTNMYFQIFNFANTDNRKDVSDNNWHHYVAVWDQSNGVKRLYVDGVVSVASNTAGQPYVLCPQRHLVLGGQQKATGFESWFNGLLYDVRIYKQIMYKAEVDAIRTVPSYPPIRGTSIRIL